MAETTSPTSSSPLNRKWQDAGSVKNDLAKVRTGEPTRILDHVMVDYYGNRLRSAGGQRVAGRQSDLGVQRGKEHGRQGREGIRDSDLGLNPSTYGDIIRCDALADEERRRDLIKWCAMKPRRARSQCAISAAMQRHVKDMVKAKTATEDEERRTRTRCRS